MRKRLVSVSTLMDGLFFAGRGREMARAGMLHRGGKNGAE